MPFGRSAIVSAFAIAAFLSSAFVTRADAQVKDGHISPFSFLELKQIAQKRPKKRSKQDAFDVQLGKAIYERGVDFVLTLEECAELEKVSRTSKWMVCQTIEANVSDELLRSYLSKLSKEKLYKFYMDNYAWVYRSRTRFAIYSAKEYLERYKTDNDAEEMLKYFEAILPILEESYRDECKWGAIY